MTDKPLDLPQDLHGLDEDDLLVAQGLADLEAGRTTDQAGIFARWRAKYG